MGKTRTNKRKRLWTTREEELLIEIWKAKINKLRGVRRNIHILEEIKLELENHDCAVSVIETKNKIHNLTIRYAKEKSIFKQTGSPSTWTLYSKVNSILGSDENVIEENIDSNDDCSYKNKISKTSQASSTKLSSIHTKYNNSKTDEFVICRSCVGECTNYKSLYKIGLIRGEKTTLAALLTFCTNLEFSNHESSLPSFICSNCILELTKSYIFIKKVQEADKLFRVQLNTNNNMEKSANHQEQCKVKVGKDEADLNKTEIKSELPQVLYENQIEPNVYNKAEDYIKHILQDEMEKSDIDYETVITKEETKLQEIDQIKVKEEIEDCDIQKLYTDLKPEKQYDIENSRNPLEITTITEHDKCVEDRLVIKKPNDIHFIICKICSKQFKNKKSFKWHMQLHSDTLHKCKVCGEDFKTICAFEVHKSICGRSHRQPSNLKAKLKMHFGETGTYTCHICGKKFSRKCGYKIHMLIHNGEKRFRRKPFLCDICGIAFHTYKQMWTHRNNHGGLRKFKCSKCFKRFTKAQHLERHVLGHKKTTSFNCQICSQSFKRESSMLIHLRFHQETITS